MYSLGTESPSCFWIVPWQSHDLQLKKLSQEVLKLCKPKLSGIQQTSHEPRKVLILWGNNLVMNQTSGYGFKCKIEGQIKKVGWIGHPVVSVPMKQWLFEAHLHRHRHHHHHPHHHHHHHLHHWRRRHLHFNCNHYLKKNSNQQET